VRYMKRGASGRPTTTGSNWAQARLPEKGVKAVAIFQNPTDRGGTDVQNRGGEKAPEGDLTDYKRSRTLEKKGGRRHGEEITRLQEIAGEELPC